MDYTAEINTQTTLLKIVERLPYCLNSRWIRRARKIREKGGNVPTIENLTEFVDDDPVYSRLNKLHETREQRKTGSAKVTKPWSKQAQAVAENPGLSSVYGIKKASILNQVSYFHVENGLPPDLAHDLLEVVPAVLCEVV
ncbi:hypothetical protein HOLleu_03939 [Holothuria leucospilota]|uniref:Uncharacterized protein n=1 Tax=Holothuria leucospilota TaxID=206669 RepID=A0A9Q1HM47_HOLLE|nr:hypothetical protein HOLleu_03939 [Holothuria leucospilota]